MKPARNRLSCKPSTGNISAGCHASRSRVGAGRAWAIRNFQPEKLDEIAKTGASDCRLGAISLPMRSTIADGPRARLEGLGLDRGQAASGSNELGQRAKIDGIISNQPKMTRKVVLAGRGGSLT